MGLMTPGISHPVPTKIEFSRRGMRDNMTFDSVMPTLLHSYGITPFITAHYPGEIALLQKIEALATRSVTQARDVFDFHILQSQKRFQLIKALLNESQLETARQNALALSFDDFKGQVLAYLSADDQAAYDSPGIWESMQLNLIDMLYFLANRSLSSRYDFANPRARLCGFTRSHSPMGNTHCYGFPSSCESIIFLWIFLPGYTRN